MDSHFSGTARPSLSTGQTQPLPRARAVFKEASWSVDKTPIPPSRSPAIWRKAILDASVPPEVNTISEGNAPNRAATAARASSTASRTLLAQP